MTLLVLAHINAGHHRVIVKEELRQSLRQLGLTHTRSTEEDKRADRLSGIIQSRTRATHRIRDNLNRLLLPHYSLVQLRLHIQELLALRREHTLHGDASPARYHLGNILRIDLLLYHRIAILRGELQLLLQSRNLLLRLHYLAVAYLRHTTIVALTLRLLCLNLEALDRVLVLLYLLQQITLTLPLGTQGCLLGLQLLNIAGEVFDTLLIVLAAYSLSLNLQLTDTAVEVVNILGHRVHLQTKMCRSLIHQINRLVGQETRGNVAVRKLHSRDNSLVLDTHLVVVFISFLQASQDGDCILGCWLIHHHLLETTLQSLVLLKIFLELIKRGSSNGTQLTTSQSRLQDVCRIHRTA